jgi:hypothetical protein
VAGGEVQAWYGWSVNFKSLNKGYRTLYFDYVENTLAEDMRVKLFGEALAQLIESLTSFVFLFVTSCAYKDRAIFTEQNFMFRRINNVIHPGVLSEPGALLATSVEMWTDKAIHLLTLQGTVLLISRQ